MQNDLPYHFVGRTAPLYHQLIITNTLFTTSSPPPSPSPSLPPSYHRLQVIATSMIDHLCLHPTVFISRYCLHCLLSLHHRLSSAVPCPPSPVRRLPSTVSRSPSPDRRLRSAAVSTAVSRPPSPVRRLPSAVSRRRHRHRSNRVAGGAAEGIHGGRRCPTRHH